MCWAEILNTLDFMRIKNSKQFNGILFSEFISSWREKNTHTHKYIYTQIYDNHIFSLLFILFMHQ